MLKSNKAVVLGFPIGDKNQAMDAETRRAIYTSCDWRRTMSEGIKNPYSERRLRALMNNFNRIFQSDTETDRRQHDILDGLSVEKIEVGRRYERTLTARLR